MDEFLTYLKTIAPIPETLETRIRGIMVERNIKRKEVFAEAGKINRQVHFIINGLVRCYKTIDNAQGKEVEINKWFYKEGDFLAYRQSYDKQQPSQENYQAVEPSLILTSTFEQLDNIYREFPLFIYHGLIITGKYASLWYNIADINTGRSAKARYDMLMEHYPWIVQRVPGKFVASFLNMHESTLSNIRGVI